ncbi:hypothetical protein FQR65_LT09517 [Abscondita terminalis]|nr:hypothetical protein FQR65_LT09517 [Abscondita terminalis]
MLNHVVYVLCDKIAFFVFGGILPRWRQALFSRNAGKRGIQTLNVVTLLKNFAWVFLLVSVKRDTTCADVVAESEIKEKDVDSPTKDENSSDKVEKENGDVCDSENGKADADDDIDSKDNVRLESENVCPVKRKSAGGDAPEGTPAEGVSPEKKAKLDEAAADAESNGEAEVAA